VQNVWQSTIKKLPKTQAHVIMTQIHKVFWWIRKKALLKKLNKRQALLPIKREDMSHTKKKKRTLDYWMFLKKKVMAESRQESAKTAGFKGNLQQKTDTSSPTVSLEAMLLSFVIRCIPTCRHGTSCLHVAKLSLNLSQNYTGNTLGETNTASPCFFLKISHVNKIVIEVVIRQLNEKFGKENPLPMTQGKVLEYLGMTLNYTTAS